MLAPPTIRCGLDVGARTGRPAGLEHEPSSPADRRSWAASVGIPLASFAQQQGATWRVGVLLPGARPSTLEAGSQAGDLLRSLRELGYIDGRNLALEWRFAAGNYSQFPAFAAELVRLKMDVIVTGGPTATRAAQKATITIPIVMANSDDPVASGFVKSLAHPGGNITGLSNVSADIGPKQLEMLLAMVPGLSRVAVLVNQANSSSSAIIMASIQAATKDRNLSMLPVKAETVQEIDAAFALMSKEKAGAVIVVQDAIFVQQRNQIADLALKHRLPTISRDREYTAAGGLMNYGPVVNNSQRVAAYVDKILKGAMPGDLPVEQPTAFELSINRPTAKALRLNIPQQLLLRADRVID